MIKRKERIFPKNINREIILIHEYDFTLMRKDVGFSRIFSESVFQSFKFTKSID